MSALHSVKLLNMPSRVRLRFSLRTLALVVALVAFGVWWVMWPKRTAEKFIGLLNEGNFPAAGRLMATKHDREFILQWDSDKSDRGDRVIIELIPGGRTWSDVFLGRGSFVLGRDAAFYVQRGKVSFFPFDVPDVLE